MPDLTEIVKAIFGLVPTLLSLPKERRDLRDNALRAVLVALDETYLYYRSQDRGNGRDEDREMLLARYWSAAAIPMRHVDPELANRCDLKAEYWLNPERYDAEKLNDLEISLKFRTRSLQKTAGS